MKKLICTLFIILLTITLPKLSFAQNNDTLSLKELSLNFLKQDSNAIPFSHNYYIDNDTLFFDITLKDGSYLYKESIHFSSKAKFSIEEISNATKYEILGAIQEVYLDKFYVKIKFYDKQDTAINISYQGCDKNGICYPIQNATVPLDKITIPKTLNNNTTKESADNELLNSLNNNFILGLLLAFLLGISLNLTPCVLPMLPILCHIIVGSPKQANKALPLYLSYILGLAFFFTVLGLIFSYIGVTLQFYLQSHVVNITLSVVLMLLCLSAAGLFKFQLPSNINEKVQQIIQSKNSGSFIVAFLLGVFSAIISSPCTSAPLAGAIIYLAQSHNILKGTVSFLFIGLGMGTPLLLVGLLGSNLVKKLNAYSLFIKELMAIPLLWAAFYISRNLFGSYYNVMLQVTIFISVLYLFYLIKKLKFKDLNISLVALPAIFTAILIGYAFTLPNNNLESSIFTTVLSQEQYQTELQDAKNNSQKILLYFTAPWCSNCAYMDKNVFSDKDLLTSFKKLNIKALKIDIENKKLTSLTQELIAKYQIFGIPYFVLIDKKQNTKTFVGLISKEELLEKVQ